MYKLIVRNQKNTGDAIFYDPKISRMDWYAGPSIKTKKDLNILLSEEILDFIQSLKEERKIETLSKYSEFKEECMHCPVVQLCKGIDSNLENWKDLCNISYLINVDRLYWAIFALTNMRLESIEGDIRRPE